MSLNTRRFSQISVDITSSESTRIFTDSRSSLSSSEEYGRESKRRKTTGLNSRFDRMIEAMNATYHPAQRAGRRRTHTASSSNTSDIPQTRMDAYQGHEEGRLGENFSLIKMKPPSMPGVAPRVEYQAGASSSNSPKTPSMDPITNPLPQWLCSTFSTLAAKHPLRLLLPKEPPAPQGTAVVLPSAAVDPPSSPVRREPDPIFAYPTFQRPETILGGQSTGHVDANEDEYRMLLSPNISRRSPSMDPLVIPQMDSLLYQSPPPRLGHLLSSLQIQPFSTPGPNSVLSQPYVSATMLRSTTGINEMDARGHGLPPGFDELDFVPFSTPGPGSTLSLVPESDTVPNGLPPRLEFPSQVYSIHETNSAPSPLVLPFSPGPLASHVDQPVAPNGSPNCLLADLCLPPYNAAPSDPAPAYSSDDIPEYSYYEDPTTDDSGSEPPQDHHFLDALNLPNIFATPGPGYCAPRPIYFDSPTEDPSDSDPSQPGYEIDYGSIDFRWEPFNRKSVGEDQVTPSIGPHYDTHNLRPKIADHEATCAGMTQQARDPNLALTPERVPSPSPFRFSPNQDVSRNNVLPPLTYRPLPQADQLNTPEPQTLAPVFAPAPGIYISPLRGESTGPMPPAPRRVLGSITALPKKTSLEDYTPSNSQTSHDSIKSWGDVDVKILP